MLLFDRFPKLEKLTKLFGHGYKACVGCAVTLDIKKTANMVPCDNRGCTGRFDVTPRVHTVSRALIVRRASLFLSAVYPTS